MNTIKCKELARREIKKLKKNYPKLSEEDIKILCAVMASEVFEE